MLGFVRAYYSLLGCVRLASRVLIVFPQFNLYFKDKNDPAIPLIDNLTMKNPQVSTSLFVGRQIGCSLYEIEYAC